ncbi:hypothetical protein T492DRAFT_466571 [Pavlovales sp. CCMP2436]|nr:hypothetical protein T492DRAFT_466571 [Pavlovales sp. CCMP2436]
MPPRRGRADRLGRRHRGQRVHYIRPDHLRSGRRGRGGGGGLGTDGRTRGDVMAGERRARRLAPADTHRAQNVRGLRRARAAPQAGELHRAGPPLHAPQAGSAREAVARNAGRGRPAERAKNQQGDFGNSHGSGAGHPAAHHSDGKQATTPKHEPTPNPCRLACASIMGLDQGQVIAALVIRTRRLGELRMSARHSNFIPVFYTPLHITAMLSNIFIY